MRRILYILIFLLTISVVELRAQYAQGTTGLLNIPTADMQPDGTFMGGANYLPPEITPDMWSDYSTMNYFLNITFLPFLEVRYACTLCHHDTVAWNQDRSLAVRIRPLKEARWYPSIVLGTDDVMTLSQDSFNPTESVVANRYYGSVYGVATKHFNISQEQLGVTVGYRQKTQEHAYKAGLFYGVSYRPSIYQNSELMMDVCDNIVSVGGAVKLFNHLSINAFCYDFKAFVGGLRYEIKLY